MLDTSVNVTPDELAATVEALFEALVRRVMWCVRPDQQEWAELEWKWAQEALTDTVQAYTKALMTFKDLDNIHPKFVPSVTLPDEMWDLVNEVTLASSWEEVPTHPKHPYDECPICAVFLIA